jgi:FtsP/CotA-like multicopper oxidase with cupredoxin domain
MLLASYYKLWTRRQVLTWGIAGLGATTASVTFASMFRRSSSLVRIPPIADQTPSTGGNAFNPMTLLRDFDYGTSKRENGRIVREFEMVADSTTLQLNSAISFVSWNLNGRVPGPTLRATEGDRVRIIFHNQDGHSHSIHFHGTHPAEMDGVRPVRHGKTTDL